MHRESLNVECVTNEGELKEMMKIASDEAEIILMASKSNLD